MNFDVFGLGNPLIDVIIEVENNVFDHLEINKGSMNLTDHAGQEKILNHCHQHPKNHALGGSCANTVVMLSQLGGQASFQGNLGQDEFGAEYEKQLTTEGVTSFLNKDEGPTGSTVILVTPDADRTMNTHLGKCQDLHPDMIHHEAIKAAKYLYIEGYLWDTKDQQEAVMAAVETAKKAGVSIALSLSDPFCVSRHKDAFLNLLENYVDLVFCNEDEAQQMSGETETEAILKQLSKHVGHIALTLGKQGAKVYKGGTTYDIPSFEVKAVDTTGAGDSFAAGYLFGLTQGYDPLAAGTLGSKAASLIVSQIGPRFQGDLKAELAEYLKG